MIILDTRYNINVELTSAVEACAKKLPNRYLLNGEAYPKPVRRQTTKIKTETE